MARAVATVLLACLAGCVDGDDGFGEGATSSETIETTLESTLTTTTTVAAPPTTKLTTTTEEPVAERGAATCLGVATIQSPFELAEASISWVNDHKALMFEATARGNTWEGLDWGYSFELADLTYVVVLGTYGDGTPNSFVVGPGVPSDNWLTRAVVSDGSASAVVSADWLDDLAAGASWTVRLMVDGSEIGSCSSTI